MQKFILIIFIIFTVYTAQGQILGYNLNDEVENFEVISTAGDTIKLYDLTASGQWVVLDFFFVDCPPCQSTAPIFNEFHEKFGCNDGPVYTLSISGNPSDNNNYVQFFEDTYGGDFAHGPAVGIDGNGSEVDNKFNPSYYPTYTLISPENKILNLDIWPLTDYTTFVDAVTSAGGVITEQDCGLTDVEDFSIVELQVFPNPASEMINLRLNDQLAKGAKMEIYNSVGQKLSSFEAQAGQNNINISNLSSGMYHLRISDDKGLKATAKFSVL